MFRLLSTTSRIALVVVAACAALPSSGALAAEVTIVNGQTQTTNQSVTDSDHLTIENGGAITGSVVWTGTSPGALIDNYGTLGSDAGTSAFSTSSLSTSTPKITINNYSTGETQVAGEIVYGATGKPLAQYLSEKIWATYGMEAEANWWLDSPDGVEIGGSGISATLRDYGRFGLFIMNDGIANGQRVLPEGWVAEAGSPKTLSTGAALNYGYLWWMSGGQSAADGAFYAYKQTVLIGIEEVENAVVALQTAQAREREFTIALDAANNSAILSRSDLEDRIYGWGEEVESNAIEFLIHSLRKKLGTDTIRNVRGAGWMVTKRD